MGKHDAKPKVLLVDDDQIVRQMLGSVLAHNGYDVAIAANGEEALRAVSEQAPDVALLDYIMPGMNGAELAARLRSEPRTQSTPIVMLSAAAELVDGERGEDGPLWTAQLEKPIKIKDLLATVASLCRVQPEESSVDVLQTGTPAWRDRFVAHARGGIESELGRLATPSAQGAGAEVLDSARRLTHQLAGSAPTFGFDRIGEQAGELERHILERCRQPVPLELDELQDISQSLQRLLEQLTPVSGEGAEAPGAPAPIEDRLSEQPTMLLLHDDTELTEAIVRQARRRNIRVETFQSSSAALARAEERAFALIVVGGSETLESDCALVAQFRRIAENASLCVLSVHDSTRERVYAARNGADHFLCTKDGLGTIVDNWVSLLREPATLGGRLVCVDDDPSILRFVREAFAGRGWEVFELGDPESLFERLPAVEPDLLLCDIDMPGVNGFELTRAVRASERWSSLPIVIMTSDVERARRAEAYAAGADDFIAKPLVAEELVLRLESRLERDRMKRDALERDTLSKLYNRRAFFARATAMFEKCREDGRDAAVATLELENLAAFMQAHGLEAGDAAVRSVAGRLQEVFSSTLSITGRISGTVFAVVLCDARAQDLTVRLDVGLASLESDVRLSPGGPAMTALTLGVGVAAAEEGFTLGELVDRTVSAKRRPRRVTVSQLAPIATSSVSPVYVVEDDPVLSEMLSYALTTAGFETKAFHDGDDALNALLAAPTDGERPVVLLDVDLPRIDGFRILGELDGDRPGQYRVVLMTAHGSEADQIKGLRSSAVDYIVKPLKIPLIVEKVRKLLRQPA